LVDFNFLNPIKLANYDDPIFQLLTVKKENDTFVLVKREALGNEGQKSKFPRYVKPETGGYEDQAFKQAESAIENKFYEQSQNLLLSLNSHFWAKPDTVVAYRDELGIPQYPGVDYYLQLCGDEKVFYIDRYIEENPLLAKAVDIYCQKENINTNYIQDKYTVGAYLLFGNGLVTIEWQLTDYLLRVIGDILQKRRNVETIDTSDPFIRTLLSLIEAEIKNNEDQFYGNLDRMEYYLGDESDLQLMAWPNVHIIQEVNSEGHVIRRWLENSPLLDATLCRHLIPAINVDVSTAASGDIVEGVNPACEIFPHVDKRLNILAGKYFLELPVNKQKVRPFRDNYRLSIESVLGSRTQLIKKSGSRQEEVLQKIIEYNGVFGFPAKTAGEILDDYSGNSEEAVRQFNYRFRNIQGLNYILFNNKK